MILTSTKPELFAAACRFISNEETRYYLRGVFVQPLANGGAVFVTTDGHRAFVGIDPEARWHIEPESILFAVDKAKQPLKTFKSGAVKLDGQTATYFAGIEESGDGFNIQHVAQCSKTKDAASFPDWTRIVPSVTEKHENKAFDQQSFNVDYMADFGDIEKKLTGKRIGVCFTAHSQGKGNPALVSFGRDDCFGILMPMRTGAEAAFEARDSILAAINTPTAIAAE